MVTTPIAQNSGIKKNIFEQALDKAKEVISSERKSSPAEEKKVEPAKTQIKNQIKTDKADAYVSPDKAVQKPSSGEAADENTVKKLWNKAVNVIQEDVVKPIEKATKKITGYDSSNKPQTETVNLKLGSKGTTKDADGDDITINELASDEQIQQVRTEVSRNANIILNNSTRNGKAIEPKERTYEELSKGLEVEAEQNKAIYESNIDLKSNDTAVLKRNEEIKQAWANLEQSRQLLTEYRKSLSEDKDELADITARENEIDKQLEEIENLQKNLRTTVASTVTLSNGAKLTNERVEEDGVGIKQISGEELRQRGIKPELLGTENAFIEFSSKVTDANGTEKTITQQHLVNSSEDSEGKKVTNITTDAQDLNNDGKIDAETELPSDTNKPLEKILSGFSSGNAKEIQLSSVQFSGDKVVIPPSARGQDGKEYTTVYGNIPDGNFKSLKLIKEDSGTSMKTEATEAQEFWNFYQSKNNSLTQLIDSQFVENSSEDVTENPTTDKLKLNLSAECLPVTMMPRKFGNGNEGNAYVALLNQDQYEELINTTATHFAGIDAGRDAKWLNEAYTDRSLSTDSKEQEKTFGNYDLVIKRRDNQGNFTYELVLSEDTYRRFENRLEQAS